MRVPGTPILALVLTLSACHAVLPLGQRGPDGSHAPVILLAGGWRYSCTRVSGKLHCWGENEHGQLGDGNKTDANRPVPVSATVPDWLGLAANAQGEHSCALRAGGELWCWGRNWSGQLGRGTQSVAEPLPGPAEGPASWSRVAVGSDHTCGVASDDSLWCWGRGYEAKLGLEVDKDDRHVPTRVKPGTRWHAVAPGNGHTCAIRSDGTLFCWGRNTHGQLGIGKVEPGIHRVKHQQVGQAADWRQVAAGQQQTCGIRGDGTLWCWGANHYGMLGLGKSSVHSDIPSPTRVGSRSDWTAVSLCWFHTCGLRQGGGLWCWGRNYFGELGLGDKEDRDEPARVPGTWQAVSTSQFQTCAISDDGDVYCTGRNLEGQLGLGDNTGRDVMTRLAFGP